MPSLEYFLVAESVSVDRDSGSLSIFHVTEDLVFPELPAPIPRLVAVSSWRIAPDEIGKDFQATLKVHKPWHEANPQYEQFPINFTAERLRHRINHWIVNLHIKQPCDLRFEILLNGEHKASHIVTCRKPTDQD